jgi:hypothetical protein
MLLVSAVQFKSLNRGKTRAAGLGVRKQMIAPAEIIGADARALRFTISTGTVDREQDRIALAGWDLANFRRNPSCCGVTTPDACRSAAPSICGSRTPR